MRILVADDDLVSRLAMQDVLQQCGSPDVVMVEDGAAAWAVLEEGGCFDLLCLDIRMPPPDGLELVARLRASTAWRRLPALLITSSADRETVLAATRADLQGFLVKPVGPDTATRLLRVLSQLDASLLEPAAAAAARLRIDADRHARYVAAFVEQVRSLAALAGDLSAPGIGERARSAFASKAVACRTAALTLGSPRIELVLADALAALESDRHAVERALRQAVYWLERLTAVPGRPSGTRADMPPCA